jgi:hypothetical protein
LKRTSKGDVFVIGLPHDDKDARMCGFPSITAQMLAIAIPRLSDNAEIRLVARIGGASLKQRESGVSGRVAFCAS